MFIENILINAEKVGKTWSGDFEQDVFDFFGKFCGIFFW